MSAIELDELLETLPPPARAIVSKYRLCIEQAGRALRGSGASLLAEFARDLREAMAMQPNREDAA